ncbi:MAG: hypothetical protein ACI4X9_02625 [Kiritimatiellia bacterium]
MATNRGGWCLSSGLTGGNQSPPKVATSAVWGNAQTVLDKAFGKMEWCAFAASHLDLRNAERLASEEQTDCQIVSPEMASRRAFRRQFVESGIAHSSPAWYAPAVLEGVNR